MEEQTVAELEFENARLHVDLNLTRFDGCMLMVDRLLSMHNHVQNYGIDRTFLALYNEHNLLNNICNVKFPACEDVLSDYDLNKRYFEICMEGLGDAISDAFKWVIDKIKALLNWIGEMWNKFWGLFKNKAKENTKIIAKLRHAHLKDNAEFDAKYVSPETITKFNEIMNKLDQNIKDGKAVLSGTGTSDQEANQILTYLTSFTYGANKDNEAVKSITIRDNNGKDQVINLAERNNKNFEKLTNTIGVCIQAGKVAADRLESEQKGLEQAHSAMQNGANKDRVGNDIANIKQAVVKYRKRIDCLSKMLKLVLDGTVLTNKTLKTIGKYCTFASNPQNAQDIADAQSAARAQT